MLACVFLSVPAADERRRQPRPDGMVPLTSGEIHHLLNVLVTQSGHDLQRHLRWSARRRTHQHRARIIHHRIRGSA
jgi:hypothetical protein